MRRRVGFHDYATIYSIPGLYERVFYDALGMRSAEEVVGAYGRAGRQYGYFASEDDAVVFDWEPAVSMASGPDRHAPRLPHGPRGTDPRL